MSMGVVVSPFCSCIMVLASSCRNVGMFMVIPLMVMLSGSVWLVLM